MIRIIILDDKKGGDEMIPLEDEVTEYKSVLTDGLKKEVLAFANTAGGNIYIGVADDGRVIGVENQDEVMLQSSSMLRDSIHPDIMMFVSIRAEELEGREVVHIAVSEGTNKPYYLIKNGLKPSGVYVRQGSASVQASAEQIRRMIKQTDGDVYEDNTSLEQELTFQKTKEIFQAHQLKFGTQQMKTLGVVRQDHSFTNLALLLSDQCPFTIKAAVFQGKDQAEFKDRREFEGPLLKQLEDCYTFLQLNNPVAAMFHGLYRQDEKSYPDDAIREALLNCIVHRDYSYSASTLISIYSDRMEFVSIGGLLPGVQKEDVLLGLSVCRNRKLADIFYRLDLIEAYGTGLLKIKNAYRKSASKPELLVTQNAFKIILPKMIRKNEKKDEKKVEASHRGRKRSSRMIMGILSLREKQSEITRKDVEAALQVSSATAARYLREMVQEGKLHRMGKGRETRYSFA